MRPALFLGMLLVAALPAALPADRDFLTSSEADQIREVQEPSERIKLYIKFASQRLNQVQQWLSKDKPGRAVLIHDALDDYTNIIDAIDDVVDDALRRNLDVKAGVSFAASAEKDMLASLQKIASANPQDIGRYDFILKQAISGTSDSLEAAGGNLDARKAEVAAKEAKEKKELEGMMQPKDREAKLAAEKQEEKSKRKAPTLYRPGEKKKQDQQ